MLFALPALPVLATEPEVAAEPASEPASEPVSASQRAGEEIFHRVEAAWNDRDERAAAVADSKRVLRNRVGEPYAYLAWSLSALADGHKNGDRFRAENYLRGSLSAASELADVALERGPSVALGHAHRAFLHLVSGGPTAARDQLERARELQPIEFHSLLYSAVLEDERGQSERAYRLLGEAASAATHPHHHTMLNRARVRVARSDRDRALEEQLHLENIEMNPASAHAHGSYADFLLREYRVEEAAARYEQATAIQPYPAALRGLEKARLRMRLSRGKTDRSIMGSSLASGTD